MTTPTRLRGWDGELLEGPELDLLEALRRARADERVKSIERASDGVVLASKRRIRELDDEEPAA